MLVAWVAFPLLLGVLAFGCGALVERASGRTLPLEVRLPCGTATIVAVLDLFTRSTATVGAAVPAVCVLAAAGLVLRPPWRWRPIGAKALAPGIAYAIYAAPIVLSGSATWAGYVKLDDTATWLALVDRVLSAGHSLAGLPTSTYADTLTGYLTNGYPVGSFLPLGLGHAVLGQDIAWLSDPWMAFMAAMLAFSLQRIAAPAVGEWLAGAAAAIATAAALLYGYYLWGGIKEMAAAMLVAAFAASAPLAFEGPRRVRAAIPALVVTWAVLAALSAGGLVWLLPGGAIALLLLALAGNASLPSRRALARAAVAFALVAGVGAYLALRPGGFFARNESVLTGGGELGNLIAPLHLRQIAGIWIAGDFRLRPSQRLITNALIALAVLSAAGALVVALRKARRELALYLLCASTGALIVYWAASPWLAGKALASASPAIAFAALLGLAMALTAWRRWRRAAVAVAGLAIAAGIVWSDLLAYRDASLAPRAQLAELARIGEVLAGQGPTLMTDYSPYGARHFLREAEAESASELRSRLDPLISGRPLPKATTADIDQFQLDGLLAYRTLVLRRSPVASRPPSPYRLLLRDRFWEVWQRPTRVDPPVLAHMPLGDAVSPGAIPSCSRVNSLAHAPGVGSLEAVVAPNPLVFALGDSAHPRGWKAQGEHLTLVGAGTARIEVRIPRAGRYEIWLGGSISGPVAIAINGTRIGTARYEVQEDAQYVPFGSIGLEAGRYELSISYDGGDWRPGSGGPPATVGPLVLKRQAPEPQPFAVAPAEARTLCGRTLDWIEALGA